MKGDLETRAQRIEDGEKAVREHVQQLKNKIANFDQQVIEKGKEFASAVIQVEYMPIVRDVLHTDLKASDEQIAIFEEKFMDRFKKRLEGLGIKDEQTEGATEEGQG